MKQILAIFRKDARHFWPETLVSLGLLAALVGVYPQQWRRPIPIKQGSRNIDEMALTHST